MSNISFDINDFRSGIIGSKVLGSGTINVPFEGFLAMDDVMITGSSITKRPPLRYLCRVIDNIPRKRQFLSYGDNVFYGVGQNQAFTIRDGKTIETLADSYNIVSYEENNEYDIVTFDKAIDLTKGNYVLSYINNYVADIYVIYLVSGTTSTYVFDSFTNQKSNRLIWLTHVKQIKVTNVAVSDYVDNAAGVYVTGRNSPGFTITIDGTISANTINADTITTYGVRNAIGSSSDGTANSTININLSGNPSFNLAAEFGQKLFWIRSIYRGLIVSTDTGVFYMKIDGSEAELTVVDNKVTSDAKPVFYKNYLIYADSSGESLSYIKVEPFSSVAFSADLTFDNDAFVGHGGIRRLIMYYNCNVPYVLCIMNDGACIAVAITENQRNYEISASLMRWFVGYIINDAVVYKGGSLDNILVLSVTYLGFTSICTMRSVNPPIFTYDVIRDPFLDFYREITTDDIFPLQIDIELTRKDPHDSTFIATTNYDYFTPMFLNAILNSYESFRILYVVDKRTAVCEVVLDNLIGNYFLLNAGSYSISINGYSGLNHLYAFISKDSQIKCNARVDDVASLCDIADDGGIVSFNYGNKIVVGFEYLMYLHTSPILPAGQTSYSRAGVYGNAEIVVHTIGKSTADVFVGFGKIYDRNAKSFKANAYMDDGFFRSLKVGGVRADGNSVGFSLFSDSIDQIFVSCISVSINHGKS